MTSILQTIPILILYPHSRCNCRCVMCDIWKDTSAKQMSAQDLDRHLQDIENLGVQWVVLSGGEPLMHPDLFRFCHLLRKRKVRTTLLSTGLLLERYANQIVDSIDEVIISLDGPPTVHDMVRRVPSAFKQLRSGMAAIHQLQPDFPISARSTVQRMNYSYLSDTARTAKELGCRSVSFLAADLTSEAFNRLPMWNAEQQGRVALTECQLPELDQSIRQLIAEWGGTGFVLETPEKLRRISLHFRAHLGLAEPIAPRCNAPWVSTVVEADGTVRPCFFQRPIGRIGQQSLIEIINAPEAVAFRSNLAVENDPICRRCVCSLNLKPNNFARETIGLQN